MFHIVKTHLWGRKIIHMQTVLLAKVLLLTLIFCLNIFANMTVSLYCIHPKAMTHKHKQLIYWVPEVHFICDACKAFKTTCQHHSFAYNVMATHISVSERVLNLQDTHEVNMYLATYNTSEINFHYVHFLSCQWFYIINFSKFLVCFSLDLY